MLIGGHRRRAAAILNQIKTLNCLVRDIPPKETHHEAVLDNLHEDMDWWDWDMAIAIDHEDNPNMTQRELADWEGVSDTKVNFALKIANALTQTAKELVDENLQKTLKNDTLPLSTKNKGFLITESHLLVLADLGDTAKVESALRKVLDEYLTEPQTKELVQWDKDGGKLEDYKPGVGGKKAKPVTGTRSVHLSAQPEEPTPTPLTTPRDGGGKPAEPLPGETAPGPKPADSTMESAPSKHGPQHVASAQTPVSDQALAVPGSRPQVENQASVMPISNGNGQTIPKEGMGTHPSPAQPQPQSNGSAAHPTKGAGQSKGASLTDTPLVSVQTSHGRRLESDDQSVFWGTMAGIPWIKAIRAKIKAGEELTVWERLFLVAAFFGRILHWLWHITWPRAKRTIRWIWHHLRRAFNGTLRFLGEVVGEPAKKLAKGLVYFAFVVGLVYGVYLFFFHPAGLRGLASRTASGVVHWVGSRFNPWGGDSKKVPEPTPGPKSPVSDQALAVPISKPDMGTPIPTPVPTVIPKKVEVPKTKHLKPKTANPVKKAVPIAVVATPNSPLLTPNSAAPAAAPSPLEKDKAFALKFTQTFYDMNWRAPKAHRDELKAWVQPANWIAFYRTCFADMRLDGIVDHKWTQSFIVTQPVFLMKSQGDWEEFWVCGVLNSQKGTNAPPSAKTQAPIAMRVRLVHSKDGVALVNQMSEEVP
jgi:hypothetical protein